MAGCKFWPPRCRRRSNGTTSIYTHEYLAAVFVCACFGGNQQKGKMQMLVQNKNDNANNEADNILAGVAEDAGKLILKFNHNQGVYQTRDEPVAIGSQFLAHTSAWQKVWTHFAPDGSVIEQKIFVVKDCREKVPKREELGDDDESKWSKG